MRSRPLSLLPELRHRRLRLVWGLKRWRAFQAFPLYQIGADGLPYILPLHLLSPLGSLQAKSNGESGSPGSVITASGAEAAVLVQGLPTVYLTGTTSRETFRNPSVAQSAGAELISYAISRNPIFLFHPDWHVGRQCHPCRSSSHPWHG
jgi:hypothetical protein